MTGQGLDPVLRFAIKGVASGIGLVFESINVLTTGGLQTPPPGYFESAGEEEEWTLDDAQHDLVEDELEKKKKKPPPGIKTTEFTETFVREHPLPHFDSPPRIALPVIIPQRRPKDRTRGFIRAYAPVLKEAGIDQKTFFGFLDNFDHSTAANAWLNAINLASFAGAALPHPVSIAISVAVAITNTYLDRINVEFFQPRGLYALVMTWRPGSQESCEQVDVTTTISKFNTRPHSGASAFKTKFKRSAGVSVGDYSFPEAVPLVFPGLDKLAEESGEETKKKQKKVARARKFVTEYNDKRAQARYAGKNPESLLAQTPKHTFKSRYADPNHPAASGNLIRLITGGHINPAPHSAGFGGPGVYLDLATRAGRGMGGRSVSDSAAYGVQARTGGINGRNSQVGGLGGLSMAGLSPLNHIIRKLKNEVLYLMIVNMPTAEEMVAAEVAINEGTY
ncbi:hypothetical protein BDV97DRAFT_382435 [Delphinella strobiligena]|nr:hypothetical protein BDV97DRAFT_382435 [Delphinella strobiligena]